MKILGHTGTPEAQDTVRVQSPVKVCMHVAGEVLGDNRVLREAAALVGAGFVVSIVDVESDSTRPIEEDISGICVKHIIMPAWYRTTHFRLWYFLKSALVRILTLLRLVRTSADIYHAHDIGALAACYLAARLHCKPLVFDAHELRIPELDSTYWSIYWPWMRKLLARFLVAVLPRCAGVITVSPPIAQEISKRYSVPKVTVIRNVPVYRAVGKSDRLRQRLGLSPNVRIALYQGNLQPDRGLDKLIRAAAFLDRDNVIVLMGNGVGTTPSELEALISSERVADRVKVLPPVPYAELLDWTASADIGLHIFSPDYSLSIRMCLPNKLFEYLMAGLPVLTSPLDAVMEVIRTYEVGQIVSSLAPADIGMAINSMLADHVALARMHCNALSAAKQDLHWGKENRQLIRLYRDILATQGETFGE
jgi:glycosyltransferase involved in cell wall biosynthesis